MTLTLDPTAFDETTRANIQRWLDGGYDDDTKAEIRRLAESNPEALSDAFYTSLAFGTGGLRGVMGVGTNRMNQYTVRAATQGLATYIKQAGTSDEPSVFIAYDSRHQSRAFADEAARVLAANGIKAYVTASLRPTPLASFGCRHYGCSAAVMITASHNPPEYNGYKVYWSDGAQVTPPHDKGIINEVAAITDSSAVPTVDLPHPLVEEVGTELDDIYVAAIQPMQHDAESNQAHGSDLKVVYTNLHGTGNTLVPRVLADWGFTDVAEVAEQAVPDANFSTVESPNPEERAALSMGIDQMLASGADLLLANDPDADRVGIAVKHGGEAVLLTGNQIASVCQYHVCEALRAAERLPANAAFVKTIVTTELLAAIAHDYKSAIYDCLPGFKYIAQLIREWEVDGRHEFLFGGEESYGYLLGTHARDKDGVIICALLCEVALAAKRNGETLVDLLHDLYAKYGIHRERLVSVKFPETRRGRDAMVAGMEGVRNAPPASLGGTPVVAIEDYLSSRRVELADGSETPITHPQSNILVFWLADRTKVVVRPSGTEPKIKLYCGAIGEKSKDAASIAEVDKRVDAYLSDVEALLK